MAAITSCASIGFTKPHTPTALQTISQSSAGGNVPNPPADSFSCWSLFKSQLRASLAQCLALDRSVRPMCFRFRSSAYQTQGALSPTVVSSQGIADLVAAYEKPARPVSWTLPFAALGENKAGIENCATAWLLVIVLLSQQSQGFLPPCSLL